MEESWKLRLWLESRARRRIKKLIKELKDGNDPPQPQKIKGQVISTSEIKISVLIDKKNTKKALVALHKEFKLNI